MRTDTGTVLQRMQIRFTGSSDSSSAGTGEFLKQMKNAVLRCVDEAMQS